MVDGKRKWSTIKSTEHGGDQKMTNALSTPPRALPANPCLPLVVPSCPSGLACPSPAWRNCRRWKKSSPRHRRRRPNQHCSSCGCQTGRASAAVAVVVAAVVVAVVVAVVAVRVSVVVVVAAVVVAVAVVVVVAVVAVRVSVVVVVVVASRRTMRCGWRSVHWSRTLSSPWRFRGPRWHPTIAIGLGELVVGSGG